ncbi:MAG: hypothetical protein RL662_316 [Bacteroidota bacterium]|jgi:hypothetical protein
MKKLIIAIFSLYILSSLSVQGQELNMRVTINSENISGTDRTIFSSLEDVLGRFVNGRKWTDANFTVNERIACSMLITIKSISEDNLYNADIQLTSNRPIYNSSYTSPLFNFKDSEFDFRYIQGQNIEFSDNNISDNLTATIAFYVYIILGLDFDSFALNGGRPYFDKAMNITTNAQPLNAKGWAPFGGNKNRYALALALTEESTATFHSMWYNYHRKGLDEMVTNATRGRVEIEKAIPDLQKIYRARPASVVLSLFGDTKLDELISVYSKATPEERKGAAKILETIYPAKRNSIDNLKK